MRIAFSLKQVARSCENPQDSTDSPLSRPPVREILAEKTESEEKENEISGRARDFST